MAPRLSARRAPQPAADEAISVPSAFWSVPLGDLMRDLATSEEGLSTAEASERLRRYGPNAIAERRRSDVPYLLFRQFTTPIVLILMGAASISLALSDLADGIIILSIVLVSGLLGFWQEWSAASAVERLLETVELRTTVLRDGEPVDVPSHEVVPGDVVLLSAGRRIPADCRLMTARDLFVDEAALTGESYPVEKEPGEAPPDALIPERRNVLFLGTHVVSGTGRAVVVRTGKSTELGRVSERLRLRPLETEFEHGVRRFDYMLGEVTLALVVVIFAFNVYLERPVLDSFLFALALAVGLTPQLLPAIISVNLARGARRMAAQRVIVKRLAAIENFGSMDVLCSDKTGTLTEGTVRIHSALGADAQESERTLFFAYLNAAYETGFTNPIDEAIRRSAAFTLEGWRKLDELPYDFHRKRLSVLAEHDGAAILVTKGALASVLEICTSAERSDGASVPLPDLLPTIERTYEELSAQGFRTLGVAIRAVEPDAAVPLHPEAERDMTFLGILALADPPKAGIADTVAALAELGIRLKIITGDNAKVAARIGKEVGLSEARILTGRDLVRVRDDALPVLAAATDIFAEIEPNQKERIIRALRRAGHVVGYMGDGINDAPALHAADVSISVQGAVDVAKEAADFVLLEQDLAVLEAGVREGRRTFANTLKYVFMATSANFGNMFSMAGASLFLSFLPLLPKQILLTNLLTDLPELTIAGDRVDDYWIQRPHRWDVGFIRRFMLVFGPLSSAFDYLTFGVLILLLHAGAPEFRTGWFLESVVSASLVVLVVRTRGRFFRSRPSSALLAATIAVVVATLALPYSPLRRPFGFVPLPPVFLGVVFLIVAAYVASAELTKAWFYGGTLRPARRRSRAPQP